ncbi:MAG: HAMP domain-containing protein [Oscillospiraceae bacterium]|jgi:HAMP domain-containing protein|nr:HAMP domain-containing protein [Oscillospiraceae bacterium]
MGSSGFGQTGKREAKRRGFFSPRFTAFLLCVTALIAAFNAWLLFSELRPVDSTVERLIAEHGTVYDLLDRGNGTLLLREITPDGTLRALVPFSKNDPKRTVHIIAEHNGLVYLSISELPYASQTQPVNSIAVCDMKTVRTLCEIQPQSDESWLAVIKNASGGGIYFCDVNENTQKLTVFRADTESGALQERGSLPLPFAPSQFTVTDSGVLYALSQDSRIFRAVAGEWAPIYRPPPGTAAARFSHAGDTLYIFAVNPEKGDSVLRLAPGAASFETLRDGIRDVYGFAARNGGTWAAFTKEGGYRVFVSGREHSYSSLTVPPRFLAVSLLTTLPEAAAFILLMLGIRYILRKRRMGLILKLTLTIVPIFAAGTAVIILLSSRQTRELMTDSVRSAILFGAREVASEIDAARFAKMNWDDPFSSEYFLQLRQKIRERSGSEERAVYDAAGRAERRSVRFINYWLYRVDGDGIFTAACDNSVINLDMEYFGTLSKGEARETFLERRNVPVFLREYDKYDEDIWLSLMIPILNGETLVGVLEVSTPEWEITADIQSVISQMIRLCLCVLLALIGALAAVLAVILRALGKLRRGAVSIADGDYTSRLTVRNMDETGDIARAFNSMAASVGSAVKEIQAVSDGYSRFVPREMLSILQKESIRDVRASDAIQTKAMFLLLMTESFDRHADHLDALNRFYARLLPVLSAHGGVAERFNSRELRALLDCPPGEAADTALAMLAAVNRLNESASDGGYGAIECSILLAYADSFLGVAGDGARLNMTLFSRFSHKTDDIRKAGLLYGCRLMVEQEAFEALGDGPRYRVRKLGRIRDGGATRGLYDFYDGDTPEQIQKKDASREAFNQAVDFYYNAEYEKARALFMGILKRRQDDPSSREYLKQSHARLTTGAPPDVLFTV